MSASGLKLAAGDLETIVEHCRRELPNEACGILGGRQGRVESVHAVKNARPSPSRFLMDPAGQYRALDQVCRAGREVVGIYHSHPGAPAVPSLADREESFWPGTLLPNFPGAVQVIVSLQDSDRPVVKGYVPAAGSLIAVPIVVCQE